MDAVDVLAALNLVLHCAILPGVLLHCFCLIDFRNSDTERA